MCGATNSSINLSSLKNNIFFLSASYTPKNNLSSSSPTSSKNSACYWDLKSHSTETSSTGSLWISNSYYWIPGSHRTQGLQAKRTKTTRNKTAMDVGVNAICADYSSCVSLVKVLSF